MPATPPSTILGPSGQRLVLQAGLTALQLANTANAQFFFSSSGELARSRNPAYYGDGACHSGYSVLVSNNGATTITDATTYFDAQCKRKQVETVDYYTYGVASTYNDVQTTTTYDASGNVLEYDGRTYAVTGSPFTGNFVYTSSAALATKSAQAPYRSESVNCTFTATSVSCGNAEAMNVSSLGQSIGATATLTATLGSFFGSSSGIAYSIAASTYSGALFALVLNPLTVLPYTFQGATALESASATGTLSSRGANIPLVVDARSDANLTLTANGNAFSGVLTQMSTGRLLASLAVSATGSGAIVYSDGSQAPVVTWMINK